MRNESLPKRSRSGGYTLTELMVVVSIVSMLAGGMATAVGGGVRAQETSQTARLVYYAMQRARAAATSDGYARRLVCSASICTLQRSSIGGMSIDGATWTDTGDTVQTGPQALIAGVSSSTLVNTALPPTQTLNPNLNFFPDGTSSPGTVFVSDKTGRRHFKVYLFPGTGMARVVDTW